MGIQKDSVVDEKLKVRGVENLYIADARYSYNSLCKHLSTYGYGSKRLADWL